MEISSFGISLNYVHKRGRRLGAYLDTTGSYSPVTYVDDQGVDATGRQITVQRLDSDPSESTFLLTNPDPIPAKK